MFKLIIFCFTLILILNLTNAARNCLLPNFESNSTTDGLTNCTCSSGFEYDSFFGMCQKKNLCSEKCGNENCAIRKMVKDRFDYHCYCKKGYQSLNPNYKLKCVAFDNLPGHKIVSKNLPIAFNPFILKELNCSQTYKLVNDKYECSCFNGYKLNSKTGECISNKKCIRKCVENSICTFDDLGNTQCTCKTGFAGQRCENHFCDFKNATTNEKIYLELATRNVCGTSKCILNNEKQFECKCPSRMEKTNDGFCKVKKPCLPKNNGYENCNKNLNQFCSIRIDESSNYKCNCEMSVGYAYPNKCNNYRSIFKKPKNITHNLRMKIRIDWQINELFNQLFSNQMYNLLSTDIDYKFPSYAIPEFLNYEKAVFKSYENVDFYQPILEDKLRKIFLNGLKDFGHLNNCGNYSIYPEISFNRTSFKLTRLIETIFNVNYLISCDNLIDNNLFLDKFINEHLLQDYVENYYYLKNSGYVLPDSINLN